VEVAVLELTQGSERGLIVGLVRERELVQAPEWVQVKVLELGLAQGLVVELVRVLDFHQRQ
jgi:hypothetical protein